MLHIFIVHFYSSKFSLYSYNDFVFGCMACTVENSEHSPYYYWNLLTIVIVLKIIPKSKTVLFLCIFTFFGHSICTFEKKQCRKHWCESYSCQSILTDKSLSKFFLSIEKKNFKKWCVIQSFCHYNIQQMKSVLNLKLHNG